ncbi:DUF6888 family protein [Nostoc sp.]|uniref:DUF6888 family protein n=1 Tax=Nostoc sp. TaxID=1180 RepID=UPI0039C9B48C
MEPTSEQLKQLYRVLTWLTRMYLPVYLVTLDERTNNIVVISNHAKLITVIASEAKQSQGLGLLHFASLHSQ